MIQGDDNAHEHVLSVNKLLEQQYQIFQQTGILSHDDVVVEVHEIIVMVIHEHENHDVHELQIVDEIDEMHVHADIDIQHDVQQID